VNPHRGFVGFQTFGQGYDPVVGAQRTGDRKRVRETPKQRAAFNSAKKSEAKYARQLKQVAKQVGDIIAGLTPKGGVPDPAVVERAMRAYSDLLRPWAKAVGARMLADVSRRDMAVWKAMSGEMGAGMKFEIASAPTGEALRRLLDEQVTLITSIPTRAAERVHKLVLEAKSGGRRYSEIAAEIQRSGHVTKSRAVLIARTETARAASGLVQARATYIGSEGYIWRTAEDGDVRKSHKKLSGKFIRWDKPPVTDGMSGHAGQLPNCRCYPEPVLPDHIQ